MSSKSYRIKVTQKGKSMYLARCGENFTADRNEALVVLSARGLAKPFTDALAFIYSLMTSSATSMDIPKLSLSFSIEYEELNVESSLQPVAQSGAVVSEEPTPRRRRRDTV